MKFLVRSASFVLANVDVEKYDVCAVGITKSGRWIPQDTNTLSEVEVKKLKRFLFMSALSGQVGLKI